MQKYLSQLLADLEGAAANPPKTAGTEKKPFYDIREQLNLSVIFSHISLIKQDIT
jgi:hypothetical protein